MTMLNIKVMSTIIAFEKEIRIQLKFLENFLPPRQLSHTKQEKAIFCGTGDSFAAAQLAEVFSEFRARAHDPLDLIKNKKLLTGHDLYLISISGNTISNVKLAQLSKRATAITANPKSKLAKTCGRLIRLKFSNSGIQTAGSISFLASALTCMSLVARFKVRNVSELYDEAQKVAKRISIQGKVYILGNIHTYPVAMFCAAKIYEVLGIDAHYERIEQFSHMGLFSCDKGDTIIIFEEENLHNKKLVKYLKGCGLKTTRVDTPSENVLDKILFFIFVSELIALYCAKKKKKKECFFAEAKKLRNASSSMIY